MGFLDWLRCPFCVEPVYGISLNTRIENIPDTEESEIMANFFAECDHRYTKSVDDIGALKSLTECPRCSYEADVFEYSSEITDGQVNTFLLRVCCQNDHLAELTILEEPQDPLNVEWGVNPQDGIDDDDNSPQETINADW